MDKSHDVISAFLDDEAFNAEELADALGDPAGRALLIDLIALRHLTQPEETAAMPVVEKRHTFPRGILTIAALLVALIGGYVLGERQNRASSSPAPVPTRVIQTQGVWQDVPVERPQ